jgi:hypothetical protein
MAVAQPVGGQGGAPAALDQPAPMTDRILPGDVAQQGGAQPVGSREATPAPAQ